MGELEDKLIEALARAATAEKIADRALSLAQEAIIKIEELKATQQGHYYAYPNYDAEPASLDIPGVEPVKEPPKMRRLSPFAVQTPTDFGISIPQPEENEL